ncbi:MAG: hypothetical protein OEY69_00015 [Candidatus Krumholzibacteria bacterium]|nr:hypothetical protein [Candidatus Krumholzibacteria bacterium]
MSKTLATQKGRSEPPWLKPLQELVPPGVTVYLQKEVGMSDEKHAPVTPLKSEVPIAVKQTTEMVNLPLDTPEKVQLGQAIANMMVQVEHLKEELKKSMVAQRGAINALKGAIREHAKTLSNGYQQELASVEHHLDFNADTVKVVYKGKLLKERAMTEEEKQLDLEMCLSMGMELKAPKPIAKIKAS